MNLKTLLKEENNSGFLMIWFLTSLLSCQTIQVEPLCSNRTLDAISASSSMEVTNLMETVVDQALQPLLMLTPTLLERLPINTPLLLLLERTQTREDMKLFLKRPTPSTLLPIYLFLPLLTTMWRRDQNFILLTSDKSVSIISSVLLAITVYHSLPTLRSSSATIPLPIHWEEEFMMPCSRVSKQGKTISHKIWWMQILTASLAQ